MKFYEHLHIYFTKVFFPAALIALFGMIIGCKWITIPASVVCVLVAPAYILLEIYFRILLMLKEYGRKRNRKIRNSG